MFKWKLEIVLKCGKSFTAMYEGPESNSGDVAKKILPGPSNDYIGFLLEDPNHNLLVLRSEIAAVDISVG